MKEITAYLRPDRADDVIRALEEVGVSGMTVIDVAAMAGWSDPRMKRYSTRYTARYCQVVKLELICTTKMVDTLVDIIRREGYTGHPGDGKIFISTIDQAISIRTGEEGQAAVQSSEQAD
jgi:nitrogen regulatory protein P-II 1